MLAMGAGHVLGEGDEKLVVTARMRGDALPFVEDLDDGGGRAHRQHVTDPAVQLSLACPHGRLRHPRFIHTESASRGQRSSVLMAACRCSSDSGGVYRPILQMTGEGRC